MLEQLINEKTKKEHICTLVTIDGFDYYVSEDIKGERGLNYNYGLNKLDNLIDSYESHSTEWNFCRKVIATNNPNINNPKIIDKVNNLSLQLGLNMYIRRNYDFEYGIIIGYNEAKDTYKFTEEDVLNFTEYYKNNAWLIKNTNKEILDIWKEQQLTTIYYE